MTHLHLHRLRTAQTGVKYATSCYGTNKIRKTGKLLGLSRVYQTPNIRCSLFDCLKKILKFDWPNSFNSPNSEQDWILHFVWYGTDQTVRFERTGRTAHFERTARKPNRPNTENFENFPTGRIVRIPTGSRLLLGLWWTLGHRKFTMAVTMKSIVPAAGHFN